MKNCTRCGSDKDLGAFSTDRQKKDGLRNWCKACVREHRQINSESIKAAKLRYRADNREKVRESEKAYREANKAMLVAKQREYDFRNRDVKAVKVAEYYALHPEKKWVNYYQNRARKRGVVAIVKDFTKQDVVDAYGDACYYCGSGSFNELDHHIPIGAGGEHSIENVRPSCSECNNAKSKADKLAVQEFRAKQGESAA